MRMFVEYHHNCCNLCKEEEEANCFVDHPMLYCMANKCTNIELKLKQSKGIELTLNKLTQQYSFIISFPYLQWCIIPAVIIHVCIYNI